MLPSSMRRVAVAAPQSPALSTFASATPRSASSLSLSLRSRHTRRYSSSKPSSPANGSKDLPAGQSVQASSTRSSKASGEKRGRKPKSAAAEPTHRFPSVPSTQHLPFEALALSSFFSQHRPISITSSLPKAVTQEAFASIFQTSPKNNKSSDVISTLTRTVNDLEGPMATLTINQGDMEQLDDNMHKVELKHGDGTESSVYVQMNSMSGTFLPFRPPPAPTPESSEGNAAASAENAETAEVQEAQGSDYRVYKAVFTIEENVDEHGQIRIVAHNPHVVENPPRARTFLERMAVRQLRYEDAVRQRDGLHAISVRRQKKLKMKKKKYKKLMKRTRNERRKLDRI